MVNYLYDLKYIERNHEAYAETGAVASSSQVQKLIKAVPQSKSLTPVRLSP